MTDQPFLTRADVAKFGGVEPATVSRYLTRSRPADAEKGREAGPYADDPFPAPDGYNGRWPWWRLGRDQEFVDWFRRHKDRTGVGGRPRKDAAN